MKLFEVREDGSFSHAVRFGGNVGVNLLDDLFRCRCAGAEGFENISLTFEPVRDVFVDLLIRWCDRWSMTAKQHSEVWQRTHALE